LEDFGTFRNVAYRQTQLSCSFFTSL
jgi:hypothetical protein